MGFDVDALVSNVRVAYRHMNDSLPDTSLLSKLRQTTKSNAEAIGARKLGNLKFKRGHDLEALELYTKSVSLAAENSEESALAYGNRSAVLYRLRRYDSCLLDISRALRGELSESVQQKLRDRKIKCLVNKRESNERTEHDSKWRDKLKTNPWLACTSSKIKLACDDKWGRYMVAAKDIEPGEILSSEEFFSTSLYRSRQLNNCSYCFVKCDALISCPSCSQVMYCSDQCRGQAYDAYHRTECELFPLFQDERFNVDDIAAVRTLLVGTEQGARLPNLVENADVRSIFEEKNNPVDKPFRSDYFSTFRLQWTFDEPSKEVILRAVKVIVTLRDLSFFRKEDTDRNSMSEAELFAAMALINHLDSMALNGFAISELTIANKNCPTFDKERVLGSGIAALHNLVNHSCDPNVGEFVKRREHVFFALRPIQKGQQIFVSYGATFAISGLKERKERLSVFAFTCRCKACTSDWPVFENLRRRPEISCKDGKIVKDIMAMTDWLRRSSSELHKFETLQHAVHCRKIIQSYVRAPSVLMVLCEKVIMSFMRRWYGNFYVEDATPTKNDADVEE